MEQLFEMLLSGGVRWPYIDELLELDKALPKSDMLALLLLQHRGEASMSDLAADLNVPLSTATGIGRRLEKKKLVQREAHPKDKRVITLRLTTAGSELATRARAQINAILERVQQALSPEELQQLIQLVQKVFSVLQERQTEKPSDLARNQVRRIVIEE